VACFWIADGWALYYFQESWLLDTGKLEIFLTIELNRWLISNSGCCSSDSHKLIMMKGCWPNINAATGRCGLLP